MPKNIKKELNDKNGNDYAVILLDRAVIGTSPVDFRKEGKIPTGQDILAIGYPTGMPTKIAPGAQVIGNKNDIFFYANLDTFGGNSGSGVFNAATKKLEGILVRGATDYIWDDINSCQRVNICDSIVRSDEDEREDADHTCYGEDVTRVTNVGLPDILSKKQALTMEFLNSIRNSKSIDKFIEFSLSPNQIFPLLNKTAYELVIEQDNIELLKKISKMKNFNINFSRISGDVPLLYAVTIGAHKVISFLTSQKTRLTREYKNIQINGLSKSGNSALHIAVLRRDFKSVKTLLKNGIDFKLKNRNGLTAKKLAKKLKYKKIYKLLKKYDKSFFYRVFKL